MKNHPITRRGFLQGSAAAAAAPYVITSAALGNADTPVNRDIYAALKPYS